MTSNTFLNKSSFINTPPLFNGVMFEIYKTRFRIIIQIISFELWGTIINNLFIPTHQIDGEVVDNPNSLWTVENNRTF